MADNYKVTVAGGTVGYYTVSDVNATGAAGTAELHDSVGSGFVVGRVASTGDGARAFSATTLVNGQGRGVDLEINDTKNYWTVNMSNYADNVKIGSSYSTVNLGAGNDSASVSGENVTVMGGLGNDVVTLNGAGAVADLGAGNDSVVVSKDATITLGSGNDTVSVGNATATISDYNYDDDVLQVASLSDPTFPSAGVLGVGDAKFNLGTSAASYKAKITDGTDTKRYWWVGANATTLNAMSETRDLIMSGRTNGAGDQILGGKGNDTIYAGANDTVWGGFGGNDSLVASANEANAFAYVAGTKSKAIVSGFKKGFGSTADSIYFLNLADAYKVSTLSADGYLKFADTDTSLVTDVQITADTITDVKAQVNGFDTYNVGFGFGNLTLSTTDNDVQVVYGLGGGKDTLTTSANYMNQEENGLKVDLSNSGLIGDKRLYININNYDGGSADPNQTYMVIGSGKGGSLKGGDKSKGNSLWGGFGGDDTLAGYANTKDTFFFGHGNGNDVVSDYETNSDSLQFLTTDFGGITAETVAGAAGKQDVKITMGSGDTESTLTVKKIAEDGAISFTTDGTNYSKAKAFTSSDVSTRSYARDVDFYFGKGINTLKVGADVTADGVTIALDGSDGKFYEDVDVLDAKDYTGTASLTGSAQNQTIFASAGGSTLYGGSGSSNDTLVGGSGADTFIYRSGNGNDVIQNVGSDDTIMLYDVSRSDLTATETTAGLQIKVGSTSQTLTVEGSNAGQATFVVDGTKYHITNESGNYTWKQD